jgi:hypothetical protein
MQFPRFTGENPKIWRDKCEDYFRIFNIPECRWVIAATMHMEENAAKWVQVQKRKYGLGNWDQFMEAVEAKFGAFDYIHALNELLELKQTDSVEEYATAFENLQFQVEMHNSGYDTMFFVTQFTRGLKPEIFAAVQSQLPDTMERAVMIARVQQQLLERQKYKPHRQYQSQKYSNTGGFAKQDNKQFSLPYTMSKERQKRDYCKANNLCFYCAEPFDPSHLAKCTKRPRSQANALVLNHLDVDLTDEVLEQLAMEDTLASEFGTLSINAMAGTDEGQAIKIRALLKNKAMLILLDSGSSHSFVSRNLLDKVGITPQPMTPRVVKVANGETLVTDSYVPKLELWTQGYTLQHDMMVLDFGVL